MDVVEFYCKDCSKNFLLYAHLYDHISSDHNCDTYHFYCNSCHTMMNTLGSYFKHFGIVKNYFTFCESAYYHSKRINIVRALHFHSPSYTRIIESSYRPRIVVIDGLIGVGKSSICNYLQTHFTEQLDVFPEPVSEFQNLNGVNMLVSCYCCCC